MLNDLQRRFSTQHIISTLFQMVATLFQHYYAALRKKSSLRIVPCSITFIVRFSPSLWHQKRVCLQTTWSITPISTAQLADPPFISLQLKTSRPIFLTQMHTLMRAVQNQYKQAGSYKVNKQLSGKIVQRARFFNT